RQVAIERAAPVVQAREEALLRGALEREAYAARPGHLGPPRDAPPLSEAPGVALEARGRDAERRHRRLQLAPGDREARAEAQRERRGVAAGDPQIEHEIRLARLVQQRQVLGREQDLVLRRPVERPLEALPARIA